MTPLFDLVFFLINSEFDIFVDFFLRFFFLTCMFTFFALFVKLGFLYFLDLSEVQSIDL